jgi:enamine deaminase RidA (YjgF/YER057c/UK114 family)
MRCPVKEAGMNLQILDRPLSEDMLLTEEAMSAEARLKELGIVLPDLPRYQPDRNVFGANNIPYVLSGDRLYIGGIIAPAADGQRVVGRLGESCSVEQGYECARQSALHALARVREAAGSLDLVVRVVKVLAFVNSTPEFTQQPQVANGFSDLLVEVFGENGRHARSAIGVASLPGGSPVEVESIWELEPRR